MPPPLAAILCVGFILWLFRRHSKEAAPMSPGLWVAFLWLTIISSRPVGYWFTDGTTAAAIAAAFDSGGGGSFIDRHTYLFLIICGAIVLARRQIDWGTLLRQSRVLWIFYAYLLLSTVWSDYPFVAFKRWFKDMGNVIMILIILTEKNPVEAMRGVFVRCAYVLIPVSVLFIKYYPTLGRTQHKWTYETFFCGITLSKNALGLAALVSGLFLLWNIVDLYRYRTPRLGFRKLLPDLAVLGMCVWLLSVAQSATALGCFLIGTVVFFGSRLQWVRANLANFGWCGLGVALLMFAFTVFPGFRGAVAGVLGRDATLTNRTEIWAASLKLETNPVLGAGFASTWMTPKGAELVDELGGLSHAHNGYLETYLHSGWIGVFLLLSVLVAAGVNATRQLRAETALGHLFIALFVGSVIYNYTEVAFNTSNILGFVLWLMAVRAFSETSKTMPVSHPAEADAGDDEWKHPALLTKT
jgi:O-antigen ligase